MTVERDYAAVTINAAFLQEIKEVNQDLWAVLEEARGLCADPKTLRAEHRRWVNLIADLRDHLAMHFALEEAFGYFERPARVAPELSQAATRLREEHKSLYAIVRDLADDVDAEDRNGTLARHAPRLAERFHAYYDLLQRHETEENELILNVYDRDSGTVD
jgi:hemerythrin-like domain-containing protein